MKHYEKKFNLKEQDDILDSTRNFIAQDLRHSHNLIRIKSSKDGTIIADINTRRKEIQLGSVIKSIPVVLHELFMLLNKFIKY